MIAFADLVESVRLMQHDDFDAIDRWRRFASQARDQCVPRHGGRVARTAGDGLLMEFEHSVQAAAAAFELHASIAALNDGQPATAWMLLRIGIHPAEVLFDEHEIYGAGVNLAVRLASLAPPGGTVVSSTARDELTDEIDATIEDLGLRYLKHLDEPVRAFAVRPALGGTAARLSPPSSDALLPAICVVPFASVPAEPAHDALGHAIADDVIASLSRHPGLRVLTRASTARLRDVDLDADRLRQLHRVLEASYLLSGHYYVSGGRARLHAELCALPGGEVLWADQASASVEELFASQDTLVPHLVANVSRRVIAHELARVRSLPMATLASYTLFLGAEGLMNSLVRHDFEHAREVLQHLAERHPRQAAPHAMLARWHVFRVVQDWSDDREREQRASRELARRAIELDPRQAVALSAQALARMNFDGDTAGAMADNLAAIEADPTEPHAWAQLAGVYSFEERFDDARACAGRALAVSPLDSKRYLFESYASMAAFASGHHDEAMQLAQASVRRHALHAPSHRLLIASLWCAGRETEARDATLRYLHACPGATVGGRGRAGFRPSVWRERFSSALKQAGVPD